MLKNGEIDLLSDVSYKPERTEFMSFPDLPMGSEAYYIYIDAENREISAEDLASFNGKRIGVNVGSIQEGFLAGWAERNALSIEIVPLDVEESESLDMLARGEIDGFTTVFSFGSEQKIVPIARIGASDYYYAVNKNRPDLLAELNMALSGIQDEDPNFRQRIAENSNYNTNTNIFLTPAQREANLDALTGVKNRHAYLETEERLDRQIAEHRASEFAIVILDVNDLKKVNDTAGHKAGDQYLRDACRIICHIFKRSPIFRVGGDEFVSIVQGEDYECIEELIGKMKDHNNRAIRTGGIVIACGMAKFENDAGVAPVFERADQNMYENKNDLKNQDGDSRRD